jgi:hypothetical protein
MGYFAKLANLGFMVICRANRLGTTTMFALRGSDYRIEGDAIYNADTDVDCYDLDDLLQQLPEWRVVDFVGDNAAWGAQMLYEKLTWTGRYPSHDAAVQFLNKGLSMTELLVAPEHRPESERFQPIED